MLNLKEIGQFNELLENVPEQEPIMHSPQEKVELYIPLLIKLCTLAKLFTGKKGDAKLDQVIGWLESLKG